MNQNRLIEMSLKSASPKAKVFTESWDNWLRQHPEVNDGVTPAPVRAMHILSTNEELVVGLGIVLLVMFLIVAIGAVLYGLRQQNYTAPSRRGYYSI